MRLYDLKHQMLFRNVSLVKKCCKHNIVMFQKHVGHDIKNSTSSLVIICQIEYQVSRKCKQLSTHTSELYLSTIYYTTTAQFISCQKKKNHDLTKYASVVLVNAYVIIFSNIQIKILGSLTFMMIASSLCADTWSLLATVQTLIVSELMSVPAGGCAAVVLSWQWQHLYFWL